MSWAAVQSLESHWEALPDDRKETFAQMAVFVFQFMAGASSVTSEEAENTSGEDIREAALLLAR